MEMVMTIEQQRVAVLKKLLEGKSQRDSQKMLLVSQGYLSQLLNGIRPFSHRSALKFEARLGLIPGTLTHPPCVDEILCPDALFAKNDSQDVVGVIKEIEARRLKVLLTLIGNQSFTSFCAFYDLNPSYVSQLANGHKTIGEGSAKNLEEKLKLTPGTLVNPPDLEASDPEQLAALFVEPENGLSLSARGFIRKLTLQFQKGLITDKQISILEMTVDQFEQATQAASQHSTG
jgi:transcriptional regulator with XRE-family HTH domain